MTRLSININKVALMRNARGGNLPNVEAFAKHLMDFNVDGITVHPRPDARHIRWSDIEMLTRTMSNYHGELNIEGYPTDDFIQFVCDIQPEQCTLVPDAPDQLTSNHGWDIASHRDHLKEVTLKLHTYGIRVSLFMDADASKYDGLQDVGVDAVEIYTGPYAEDFVHEGEGALAKLSEAVDKLRSFNLSIHAGHDLNLENLGPLIKAFPDIKEVSIGQAFVADCLYYGLENTHGLYKRAIAMI
ncbi:MAG: pyridoxine 5'-phosphate synthase [Saprospirales bacterium TMED214]|nr:MAG: pyridoxine 5'-phosphate synthase [Saprospirales bacterium TMED214]